MSGTNQEESKNNTQSTYDLSSLDPKGVYIISYGRSAIGSYGGNLSKLSASQIASKIITGTLTKHNNIPITDISEVILGNVLQANAGQNPARQASIYANIPNTVPCTTVNKICASGMKSIIFAAQSIAVGYNSLVICGGMESMSQCPYYLPMHRFGSKMGHKIIVDGMIKDGLWDVYSNQHMGSCAEITAQKYNITREAQDTYAIESFHKAKYANDNGIFIKSEIIGIEVVTKYKTMIIDMDEGCNKLNENKLRKLPCVFEVDSKTNGNVCGKGSITAGNCSQLSDGAAILILCSGEYLQNRRDIQPLYKIEGYADVAQDPIHFATAPSTAIVKALKQCGMGMSDLDFDTDFIEINEAFAVAVLANTQILKLEESVLRDNVNVYGGAIAIGHPLGCSGARICCTLMSVLENKNGRLGIAGICNGGGGASAMVIRRLKFQSKSHSLL